MSLLHLFNDDTERQITADYLSGMSLREIGFKWYCDPTTVKNIVLRNGGKMRPKTKHPPEIRTRIIELCKTGKRHKEISTIIGIDYQIVRDIIGNERRFGRI